jgi:prevent-host-death family protein
MVMIMVNIHQAKARLSEFLEAVERGEQVWICKRNQPVAELRPLAGKRTKPRPLGGGQHTFDVPKAFFEPMSDEWLDDVETAPVYSGPAPKRASRVAERSPSDGHRGKGRRR